MNREIKFRALTSGSGKWVIGDLVHLDNETLMASKDHAAGQFLDGHIEIQAVSIFPDSIGQYVGLKDKNGKDIFEGDKFEADEPGEYYAIEFNNSYARFEVNCFGRRMFHNEGGGEEFESEISRIDCNCFELDFLTELVVIGNVHQVLTIQN